MKEPSLQGLRTVNGNNNAFAPAVFRENVVTSFDASQLPALAFDDARKFFAGDLLQMASSKTWS